jgi:hypothetical protein
MSMDGWWPRTGAIAAKIFDDEVVMINLSTGLYYSLDGVGCLVWALLEQGCAAPTMAAAIATRFGVPLSRAAEDLEALLAKLEAEGLIARGPAGAGSPAVPEGPEARPSYAPAVLNRYSDMGALLALDPPLPDLEASPWPGTEPD